MVETLAVEILSIWIEEILANLCDDRTILRKRNDMNLYAYRMT